MKIDILAQGILNSIEKPAILIDRQYTIVHANNAYLEQYGLISSTKPETCHSISHHIDIPCDQAGESCPLSTCVKTGQKTKVFHIHHTPKGKEYVDIEMWPIEDPETNQLEYFIEIISPSSFSTLSVDAGPQLIGESQAFQHLLNLVQRVSPTNSSVMLLGETGSGKEIVAQTIHHLSDRAEQSFVPVECSALPDALFESEMFGYIRGAFTGATTNRSGLVEAAEGGTLFLDEVGDIPLPDQVKLLRLLETKRYRRVGSTEWQQADFRLICATNRELKSLVDQNLFRADLYYRLNVFEIILPPLRDRKSDIPLLIRRIMNQLGAEDMMVSEETITALSNYDFPGNIRELKNIIERAMILSDDKIITAEHLMGITALDQEAEKTNVNDISLKSLEVEHLRQSLRSWKGDRKSLAKALGISERALYRKLALYREALL